MINDISDHLPVLFTSLKKYSPKFLGTGKSRYKKYKNKLTNLIRIAKKNCYEKKLEAAKKNISQLGK